MRQHRGRKLIRATESERVYAGQAFAVRSETARARRHAQFQFFEIDVRIRFRKCRLAGICPCLRTSIALRSPATPAAVSRWPRFVFTEPMGNGVERFAQRFRERVRFDRIAHRRARAMRFNKSDLLPAQFPHLCTHPGPAALALPGLAAKCRWCGRPDSSPCRRSRLGSGRHRRSLGKVA